MSGQRLHVGHVARARDLAIEPDVDTERRRVPEQRHHGGLVAREAIEPPFLEPLHLLGPEGSLLRRFLDGELALQPERGQRGALLRWDGF